MKKEIRPRRGLGQLFKQFAFAGAGVIALPAPGDATTVREETDAQTDDDSDTRIDDEIESIADTAGVSVAAHRLGALLVHMNPFDATRAAATAALSSNTNVRRALAETLASPFHLVGDDFVLDQLAEDPDLDVRIAASRAARVRFVVRTERPIANIPDHPHRPRVLVVDDYAGGRAALRDWLCELGCDAIATSSKIADRDIDWRELIDVLVVNHDPPWIDGEQLVVQLRQHAPDVPAILMTNPAVDTEGEPVQMHDEITLVKPIAIDELARAIATLAPKTSRPG